MCRLYPCFALLSITFLSCVLTEKNHKAFFVPFQDPEHSYCTILEGLGTPVIEQGLGGCYCYAAVFAYLANAVGYHDVLTVNDTGHGWVEIGGRYYDPHWDLCIKASCYAIPRSLSGTEGRVAFAGNGVNKKNCDK